MFADKVQIEVRAGKGGDGLMSFRHEKYQAKGGPDGGDGGKGGDVVAIADHNTNTLSRFRTNRLIHAADGMGGAKNRKHGKSGQDTVIKVPPGTVVYEGEQVLADLTDEGQTAVIGQGGRGGFGNAHFTSSTRQAPRLAELGEPGEIRQLTLELKLVADIGLVGLPNAGKSTLLSVISNARPEIADYPFTTLEPNLGVAEIDGVSMLVADIPGLIAGASEGKGLGDEFLRHIERTSVLLHLVDAVATDPVADYAIIVQELRAYQIDLSAKPRLVALTKVEALEPKALAAVVKAVERVAKQPVYQISAQAHRGLDELLRAAAKVVLEARAKRAKEETEAIPIIDESILTDQWQVVKEDDGRWRAQGERIERFGRRTDWDSDEAVMRLRDIMQKLGIAKELLRQGAQPGDIIAIGPHELVW